MQKGVVGAERQQLSNWHQSYLGVAWTMLRDAHLGRIMSEECSGQLTLSSSSPGALLVDLETPEETQARSLGRPVKSS